MSKLKIDFIKGVFWGIIEKGSVLLVGFFVTIILSRNLTPYDYGLIGMLSIFTMLAYVLVDGGFGQALVQKTHISHTDCSSVFYFNIVLGLVVYIALYTIAPYISNFYRSPELTKIARVIFILIPVNAFSIIPESLLRKEMRFKQITHTTICSSVISGMLGIYLAINGYGVWALVFQTIALFTTKVIALYIISGWIPTLSFSFNSIRSLFKFSISLLGVHTITAVFQNIYTILIGRYFNVADVGYYNQAQRIDGISSGTIQSVTQMVVYPTFVKMQNDIDYLKSSYSRIIGVIMFITLPLSLSLAIMGNNIFILLLTDKWLASVPYFQLLCIASAIFPLHSINSIILKALGEGRKYFILEIVKRIIVVVFIILTINESIYLLLLGGVVSAIISIFINMIVCGKVIGYPIGLQIKSLIPTCLATILTLVSIYLIQHLHMQILPMIILQITVGMIVYFSSSFLLKVPAIHEVKLVLFRKSN